MEAGEEVVNATLASLVRSCLDRGEVDGDNIRNEVNVSCTPANCNGNGNCILGMFNSVLQYLWLISITGIGFGFRLGHRFLKYAGFFHWFRCGL